MDEQIKMRGQKSVDKEKLSYIDEIVDIAKNNSKKRTDSKERIQIGDSLYQLSRSGDRFMKVNQGCENGKYIEGYESASLKDVVNHYTCELAREKQFKEKHSKTIDDLFPKKEVEIYNKPNLKSLTIIDKISDYYRSNLSVDFATGTLIGGYLSFLIM